MSELKVGDLVWVSDTVSDIPDQSYAAGCIMTQMDGQNEVMVSEEAWMPDVPNLAAVARVIAAHPGIGEAVRIAAHNLLVERHKDHIDQLFALAAALNGATE